MSGASLIHLPKSTVRKTLLDLRSVVKPEGILAATFVHGRRSGFVRSGWIPGDFSANGIDPNFSGRWHRQDGKYLISVNRERRGRWLNLLARR